MKDNHIMQSILSFFAEHSPAIIKLLSILVAVAASVLLYRVIFVQNVGAIEQPATADLTDVNRKLNEQKIEIDTLKSESDKARSDLEKHQVEVYNLRQTIKEKEAEIEVEKAENQQLKLQTEDVKKLDYEKHKSEVILSTADENLVFQKEISELRRRLTDYEIIAEDISDMQRLKEENEKLKQMVSSTAETPSAETPNELPNETELDRVLAEMNEAEQNGAAAPAEFNNPSAAAPADFVPNETSSIETEVLGPGPEDEVSNSGEILKTTSNTKMTVEIETLDGVSEVDKNLLDKFEKQKET